MIISFMALIVLAACAAAGLAMLRRRLEEVRRDVAPVCARCGAAAAHLRDFTCENCGHDVREAGLAVPPVASPMALLWRVAVMTLLVTLIASGVGMLLEAVLPSVGRFMIDVQVSSHPTNDFDRLEMSAAGHNWRGNLTGRINCNLFLTGGALTSMQVDLATRQVMVYARDSDRGEYAGMYENFSFDAWMREAGIEVTDQSVLHKLRQFAQAIDTIVASGPKPMMLPAGSSGYSSSGSPPQWLLGCVVIVTSLVWLLTLRGMLKERK